VSSTTREDDVGEVGAVVLVLGEHVQHLPFESMPVWRTSPVSRVPSLNFAFSAAPVPLPRTPDGADECGECADDGTYAHHSSHEDSAHAHSSHAQSLAKASGAVDGSCGRYVLRVSQCLLLVTVCCLLTLHSRLSVVGSYSFLRCDIS